MISVYIYFITSLVFFTLFIFFVHTYKQNRNRTIFYYSLVFLSAFLACFFNSIPLIIGLDFQIAAWSNVLANISFFGLIFSCFRVQLSVTDHFFKKNLKWFDLILFLDTAIAIGFQISTLQNPTLYPLGISWNLNNITIRMLSITGFLYGIYWSWLFGKVAHILLDPDLKRRMYIISFSGILDSTAATLLFSNNESLNMLGVCLFLIAAISRIIFFMIPKIFEKKSSNNTQLAFAVK